MAQLTCSSCGLAAEDDDLVCQGCSANLSRPVVARYPLPGPPAHLPVTGAGSWETVSEGGPTEEEQPRVCPHCGAPVPVPTNQVCVACQRMLGDVRPPRPADSGERAVDVQATRRDIPSAV